MNEWINIIFLIILDSEKLTVFIAEVLIVFVFLDNYDAFYMLAK